MPLPPTYIHMLPAHTHTILTHFLPLSLSLSLSLSFWHRNEWIVCGICLLTLAGHLCGLLMSQKHIHLGKWSPFSGVSKRQKETENMNTIFPLTNHLFVYTTSLSFTHTYNTDTYFSLSLSLQTHTHTPSAYTILTHFLSLPFTHAHQCTHAHSCTHTCTHTHTSA